MQSAFMRNYASDIQRANIINEGSMNYYQNALQAYTSQVKGTQALLGSLGDAAVIGAKGYADAGGDFDFGSIFRGSSGGGSDYNPYGGGTSGGSGGHVFDSFGDIIN